MPAAPEGLACKELQTRKLHSPTGRPETRLSLHDGLTAYSVLSSVGHCATVIAANALRLVTRLGDFDFETTSTQALTRQDPHGFTVRLLWSRPSPRQLHRLPRTSRGFAHSGALFVVAAPFGVHRIPSRVRDVRETPL